MIYAVGDIHGELGLLDQLMEKIRLDARGYPDEPHTLIFIGDYIDRGPQSRSVLERVMAGFEGFKVVCLRGNHEQAMLEVCRRRNGDVAKTWMSRTIGGSETLRSYGIEPKAVKSAVKSEDRLEAVLAPIPDAHLSFIENLPLTHLEDGLLFVHAGIRPGIALEAQREDDLMWIRKEFTTSRHDHGYVVVHGHTWRRRPVVRKNRVGIDTGAFATGRLTAAVFEGKRKPRFIQASWKR